MRALIDGAVYDTDDAIVLSSHQGYYGSPDGGSTKERLTLYKTNLGNFFIKTDYLPEDNFFMKCLTGGWKESSCLNAISEAEARQFIFKYGGNYETAGISRPVRA